MKLIIISVCDLIIMLISYLTNIQLSKVLSYHQETEKLICNKTI